MQGLVGKETGHRRTESEHAVGTALEEVGVRWGYRGGGKAPSRVTCSCLGFIREGV